MANSKYYYNPETCQYERERPTFWKAAQYLAGILVTAGVMFLIMVFVADKLVESELEKKLKVENRALRKHKAILSAQLTETDLLLTQLNDKERKLHSKLFDIPRTDFNEPEVGQQKQSSPNHEILLSDEDVFAAKLKELETTSQRLRDKTLKGNSFFVDNIHIDPDDALALQAVPTATPLPDSARAQLASGFGIRLNPFHKGKYMHDGLDFTAPRGTPVLATAPGKVIMAKHSSLLAGHGNYIAINHHNGYVTQYAHLDEIFVRHGEKVSKGQIIGTVGNSGGSIIPHLHYEITQHGEHVDPLTFMIEDVNSGQYQEMLHVANQQNQSLD